MQHKKKEHPKVKSSLHIRNKHRERYDFKALIASCQELAQYVILNKYGDESIDFFNPQSVKMLNKALLFHHYDIENWDIPENYLCPPIPGRADYIHHISDLLYGSNFDFSEKGDKLGSQIKCLDIGVGANCIYPIIGNKEYGWSFIGSDIDPVSIKSANKIIELNPSLSGKIELRLQNNQNDIFQGVIQKNEYFDLTICNPPFHASLAESQAGTMRKLRNLKREKVAKPILNFGGKNNELWCDGGEKRFVGEMIRQSMQFGNSCLWFSTLISKQSNLENVYRALKRVRAIEVKTIKMSQGNKTSHIVAWTFFNEEQKGKWKKRNWI